MRHVLFLISLLLVCLLCAHAEEAVYSGTAFVVHPDGFLITCDHVVQGATDIEVTIGGKSYKASVLEEDAKHDLALLQISLDKLTPLPLANSNQVQLGEEVRACGFPLASTIGTDLKATRGTVSGITTLGVQKVFQVDAPINAGNSGGPLINEKGEAVGVVNAKLAAPDVEGVGFAVPINYVRRLLDLEGIEIAPGTQVEKLDGPTLIKRVSASIAFVKVTADEEAGPVAAGDALQAKKFELVDDAGKVRARLSMAEGSPTLILFDDKGLNRAQFALGDNGQPAIILTDANDVTRVELGVNAENRPSLLFADAKGNIRTYLDVDDKDRPTISLSDADEHTRAMLRLDTDNTPSLEYYDDQQQMRSAYWLLADQTPSLSLYDPAGKLRGLLGMSKDNDCNLNFTNAEENVRARLGVDAKGVPQLMMADTAGTVRTRLGLNDNAPGLSMNDSKGNTLAMLTVTGENVPSLAMGNDGDHMTAQLCVSPEGFTELEMRDQNNVIRALMSVYGNGNAVISLSDKDGNPRIWTRMKNETPLFGVANTGGDITWSAP